MNISGAPRACSLAASRIERCEQLLRNHGISAACRCPQPYRMVECHLPGAISMPLLELDPRKQFIDASKPSLVYCQEGFRATTAASLVLRENADHVGILIDGVEGWCALGLPL